ncbi:MAG: hypothetical protein AVDCRST_MAG50-641 [uncultured Acidimicrobiales bacterium]|uniref:Uncharacterized protein n=1 Tax=uncultured Acidimicrobiales bacterium TaxID=310071 RepID=A0A6J4HEF9_9ACTN|nr:MAG: hypothetical protein AVDCRST_MAG50-641 [uncultured Acidimicrobiales bacterium]
MLQHPFCRPHRHRRQCRHLIGHGDSRGDHFALVHQAVEQPHPIRLLCAEVTAREDEVGRA